MQGEIRGEEKATSNTSTIWGSRKTQTPSSTQPAGKLRLANRQTTSV